MKRYGAIAKRPCIDEGVHRIPSGGEEMRTMEATHLLETYRDVVGRLQNEAAVPTADAASSDFLDFAQSIEHQELARLTAMRLAERARRLQIALTRVADGEYGVCSECGTSIPPKRLLAIPDATTCVACQERLEHARS
jgi:DnaK suppressor protein